jgi:hypothetical protein
MDEFLGVIVVILLFIFGDWVIGTALFYTIGQIVFIFNDSDTAMLVTRIVCHVLAIPVIIGIFAAN